jgi:siroheme synthase-like protein
MKGRTAEQKRKYSRRVVPLYPLFLKLEGRRVLVVGAGTVAERKLDELLVSGASVTVVAPKATRDVRERARRGELTLLARRFRRDDVKRAWLVVAATGDKKAQRAVAAAAERRGIFVIAVDDLPNASAYSGAILRREPFLVAISSSGEAPALTRLLREILESVLPDSRWVEAARTLRAKWRATRTPIESRFTELVRDFKRRARG